MKWKWNTTYENFWDAIKTMFSSNSVYEINMLENKKDLISTFSTLGTRKKKKILILSKYKSPGQNSIKLKTGTWRKEWYKKLVSWYKQ